MDTKPTISVSIPPISDQTYIINPDKDVQIISTPPPETITEPITLADGSVLTGTFIKQIPPTITTLGEIKQKIADFTKTISDNLAENDNYVERIDELNAQLALVQPLVDASVADFKPTPLSVETPPVETLPVEKVI